MHLVQRRHTLFAYHDAVSASATNVNNAITHHTIALLLDDQRHVVACKKKTKSHDAFNAHRFCTEMFSRIISAAQKVRWLSALGGGAEVGIGGGARGGRGGGLGGAGGYLSSLIDVHVSKAKVLYLLRCRPRCWCSGCTVPVD